MVSLVLESQGLVERQLGIAQEDTKIRTHMLGILCSLLATGLSEHDWDRVG